MRGVGIGFADERRTTTSMALAAEQHGILLPIVAPGLAASDMAYNPYLLKELGANFF
jgi:hypothetical protein